jgi:hypothetical protein
MRRTVAMAITKVALLEHCTISSSSWMIFLTRETGSSLDTASIGFHEGRLYALGRALCPVISSGSATFLGDILKVVAQDKVISEL